MWVNRQHHGLLHLLRVLVALSMFSCSFAGAALIYSNGTPDNIQGWSISQPASEADNFVLTSPASISAVRFWFSSFEPSYFSGTLKFAFRADAPFNATLRMPGERLYSGTVTGVSALSTGVSFAGL